MKNKRVFKSILGVIGAVILSVFIYQSAYSLTYKTPFFSSASDTGVVGQVLSNVTNQPILSTDLATQFKTHGMTLATLATYNGKSGQPAYIAFEGTVFDVSSIANWKSGSHHGVKAGTDITDVFASSPHSKSILKLAVVIGKLATDNTGV
jgi:predicted heme/steroid binding protein